MAYPYLNIFLAGTHSTAHSKKTWNEGDLDAVMASTLANSAEKIPFTAQTTDGKHPQDNLPIFGYADRGTLRKAVVNGVPALQIQPCEFAEGLLPQLKETALNKMSVRFNAADFSLEHICFVERPAVKDIPPLSTYDFSAAQDKEYIDLSCDADFADSRMPIAGSLFRSLREWFIGKFGLDEANKAVPDYAIAEMQTYQAEVPEYVQEQLLNVSQRLRALETHEQTDDGKGVMLFAEEITPEFSEHQSYDEATMIELEDLKAAQAKTSADFAAFQDAAQQRETALAATNAALQAQINAMREATTQRDIADFTDSLIREGKALPAQREFILTDLLLASKTDGKINFSGADVDLLTAKKENYAKAPVIAPLGGHIATSANAAPAQGKADFSLSTDIEDRAKLTAAAKARATEKGISFSAALDEILATI